MEGPALKNRRRKSNDAIVLDDDASAAHPPLKSVKREEDVPNNRQNVVADVRNDEEAGRHSVVSSETREPEPLVPSSPEVIELRQMLIASKQQQLNLEQQLVNASQMILNWEQQTAKKEEMLQRARQDTGEAVLRADRAEKLLNTKQQLFTDSTSELEEKIVNLTNKLENQEKDAEKKCGELKKQLECERKEKEWAYERGDKYKKQVEEEKERRYDREDELKTSEEERKERRRASERIADLTNELEKLEIRASKKITELAKQLIEERLQSDKRIDMVKQKLALYEKMDEGASKRTKPINATSHPPNILSLLIPTEKHAMSIDEAVEKVRGAFKKCREEARKRCDEKKALFDCEACGVDTPTRLDVTTHFLSKGHIEKVRASKASVSKVAVADWFNMLEQFELFSAKRKEK